MASDTRIELLREFEIGDGLHEEIRALLAAGFPGYFAERSYFKQLPHMRFLAFSGTRVIGHVGIDHRVIRVGERVLPVFGIIEMCVAQSARGSGVASRLVEEVCALGAAHAVPFVILMADDHRLYQRNGFVNADPDGRWLAIQDLQTVKVIERNLGDCFMVRSLSGETWPDGDVDMLGYLY